MKMGQAFTLALFMSASQPQISRVKPDACAASRNHRRCPRSCTDDRAWLSKAMPAKAPSAQTTCPMGALIPFMRMVTRSPILAKPAVALSLHPPSEISSRSAYIARDCTRPLTISCKGRRSDLRGVFTTVMGGIVAEISERLTG